MKGYISLIELNWTKMFMKAVKHSWLVRRTVAEEYTNWVLGLDSSPVIFSTWSNTKNNDDEYIHDGDNYSGYNYDNSAW